MARPRALGPALAALAVIAWVGFFLGPALAPGRALLGVDLLYRFPPWDAQVGPDWEASNHLLFDQAAQFYPWRLLSHRLAQAGLPPLWNPYAGAGSPLLANQQSAALAPVELATSSLDPPRTAGAAAAVRLVVAGIGMLLLAGELGLTCGAALFAAIAFLGSGSIAILLYHPNSNVSMWLPLIALFSFRLGRAGGLGSAALLALAAGAAFLGGHPETALYAGLTSPLFFACGAIARPASAPAAAGGGPAARGRPSLARRLLFITSALCLALLIAAPAILPFLEYLREGAVLSHRADTRFWNPPACALGLIAPEIFGTPDRPNTYFGPRNYHAVATQYAGMATAVLALVAAGSALIGGDRRRSHVRRRLVVVFAATLALALLLIYPTPLWRLATLVPLFRVSANVTGLTLVAVLLLALLGAIGLEVVAGGTGAGRQTSTLSTRGTRGRHRILVGALAVVAAAALAAGLALPLARERLLAAGAERLAERYAGVTHAQPLSYYIERLPLVFAALRTGLIRTGLLGLALALLIGPGARLARNRLILTLALVAHLAIDLAHFGRGYVPAIPLADVFPPNRAITEIAAQPGLTRVLPTGRALPPNTLTGYGVEDFRLHDAIGSAAHARFEAALSSAPFMRRPLASYDPGLLAAAGIDVIAAEPGEALGAATLPGLVILSHGAVTVARFERAWPRAFFCAEAREVESDSVAVLAARLAAAGDPADTTAATTGRKLPAVVALTPARANHAVAPAWLWRAASLLYPALGAAPPASLKRSAPVAAAMSDTTAQEIGTLVHSPLTVTASFTAPGAGWLVLLDQDFPGWAAEVDGAPARVARAFGLFRAVAVPAGLHSVTWRYEPVTFAAGLALALAALVTALVALITGAFAATGSSRPH